MTRSAPAESSAEKRRLRDVVRGALDGVTSEARHQRGVAAAELLRRSSVLRDATGVVGFASLATEIDSQPLLDCAYAAGKSVLLPRMKEQTLEFVPVAAHESLIHARFGVREPRADKPPETPAAGSLLLVPGLAFDRRGGRLGRGAGYYDRALEALRSARIPVRVVGVAMALQIVARIPMSPLDEPVDGILTESELTFWSS